MRERARYKPTETARRYFEGGKGRCGSAPYERKTATRGEGRQVDGHVLPKPFRQYRSSRTAPRSSSPRLLSRPLPFRSELLLPCEPFPSCVEHRSGSDSGAVRSRLCGDLAHGTGLHLRESETCVSGRWTRTYTGSGRERSTSMDGRGPTEQRAQRDRLPIAGRPRE